jgi:hypothetical protein
MKTPSRKTLFGIAIAVAIVVTILLVALFRRRSKYEWPVTGTPTPEDTTLSNTLQGIQNTYNEEIIAAGTDTAQIIAAEKKRSEDVRRAVSTYVGAKCPDATATTKAAVTAANQTKWDNYQTDLNNIQQAYVGLLATPSATGYTNTAEHVIAARKADITGATRKYIASVCSAFYKPSGGATDYTSSYIQWNYASTGTPTNNRGLAKDRLITNTGTSASATGATNLYTWTGYAANVYNVKDTTLYVAGTAGATFIIPIAEDLTNKGMATGTEIQYTYYTTTTGATSSTATTTTGTLTAVATGNGTSSVSLARPIAGAFYVVKDTQVAAAMRTGTSWKLSADGEPNWKKARDAGPGSYPIPTWNAT